MAVQTQYVLQSRRGEDLQVFSNMPTRLELPSGDVVFNAQPEWASDEYQIVIREIKVSDETPNPIQPTLTPLEKLEATGLSVDDLKHLLGLK